LNRSLHDRAVRQKIGGVSDTQKGPGPAAGWATSKKKVWRILEASDVGERRTELAVLTAGEEITLSLKELTMTRTIEKGQDQFKQGEYEEPPSREN